METKTALQKAIKQLDGQLNFAKAIGVKQPTVSYWLKTGRITADYVLRAEDATSGKITRYDLRPDIYGSSESVSA